MSDTSPTPSRIETAPLACQFGDQAARAADLVRLCPALAHRLVLWPRRAVHAAAILIAAQSASGVPLAQIAAALLSEHPRTLLRQAMPDAHPRLFRLLDRACLPAWSLEPYRTLNQLLLTGFVDMLPESGDLRPATVEDAASLLRADPVVRRARAAFGSYSRDDFATVLSLLRKLGSAEQLESIPDRISAAAVARRVVADLSQVASPPVAFPEVPGWRRLQRVGELWNIGETMHLCIRPGFYGSGDYTMSVLMGRSVFLHHDEPSVLAQFRRMPCDTWALAQCFGPRNRPAPLDLTQDLKCFVRSAGVLLLDSWAGSALDTVLSPLRRTRRVVQDEDDDDLDEAA